MITPINEKRKHKRFPVLYNLIKPVLIRTEGMESNASMPAIMANLSSGGMALLTFTPIPTGQILIIFLDLKSLHVTNIKARVTRCENKGGSYNLGIQFLDLSKEIADKISKMADDFDLCETRILMGDKPICRKGCTYAPHCQRTAKGHY
ncbi:MAG: PilZ domain-containing protein [Elusimicrobia bacterium]|nr:PilZ domain-containing protein [Elusimicrobiota bacterium]